MGATLPAAPEAAPDEKKSGDWKAPLERTNFTIRGGRKLRGLYPVQGNKNAALPIIAATLLSRRPVTLRRVPRIRDVKNLLKLVEAQGALVHWKGPDLIIDPGSLLNAPSMPDDLVRRLRGGVLLLAPLAHRYGEVSCTLPGGCPIGRRSFEAHWSVFRSAGFEARESEGRIDIAHHREVAAPHVFLRQASVTGTENALLLFAALGRGCIENPAREPHVLALIDLLRQMGCRIETDPLRFEVTRAVDPDAGPVEFEVPADYIDAGTLAIAAAVTNGEVVLQGVTPRELTGIRPFLEDFGVVFEEAGDKALRVQRGEDRSPEQLTAGLWPLFPTDLISLAIVLAVQSKGLCLVHDWMYEARMFFVDKLVRMGARITLCDPHRVLVEGTGRLRGITLESPDIRAGMALVVAGLCAQGETTIEHGEVILRGYESVTERLRAIGAQITESHPPN